MKLLFVFIMLLTVCSSAQTVEHSRIAKKIMKKHSPAGTAEIDSNFYADLNEVTNIDFYEYFYWVKRVYGNNSKRMLECLPDTSVWFSQDSTLMLELYYFRAPWTLYYPVVGITYQQALDYAKWRSDRVFEYILISEGLLKLYPSQDSLNYFSIENYFQGKFFGLKPDYSIPYPVYSLPSPTEWRMIVSKANELNGRNIKSCNQKYCPQLFSEDSMIVISQEKKHLLMRSALRDDEDCYYPISCDCRKPVFFNLFGCVSEYSSVEVVSMGGSWNNSLQQILTTDTFSYSEPNAWTGFRCICHWEFYQESKIEGDSIK